MQNMRKNRNIICTKGDMAHTEVTQILFYVTHFMSLLFFSCASLIEAISIKQNWQNKQPRKRI